MRKLIKLDNELIGIIASLPKKCQGNVRNEGLVEVASSDHAHRILQRVTDYESLDTVTIGSRGNMDWLRFQDEKGEVRRIHPYTG